MSDTSFTLRPLEPRDVPSVAELIARQPPDYRRFFYAFGAGEAGVAALLQAARRDVYSGLFQEDNLICVFMLRGWDEDFDTPAFGLVVNADHRGRQVLTVALEAAKLIARLAGCARIMAKVHPDNLAGTRGALRLGFKPDREEPDSGNMIYYLDLQPS